MLKDIERLSFDIEGMLTPRQLKIARLVACGLSNKEIARTCFRSKQSVSSILRRIYRILDLDVLPEDADISRRVILARFIIASYGFENGVKYS